MDERSSELRSVQERLSPRQREVLDLWEHGYGLKRTAVVTGLSVSTVRTHRAAIIDRLGDEYLNALPAL